MFADELKRFNAARLKEFGRAPMPDNPLPIPPFKPEKENAESPDNRLADSRAPSDWPVVHVGGI